jgi:hypothetical protein
MIRVLSVATKGSILQQIVILSPTEKISCISLLSSNQFYINQRPQLVKCLDVS